MGHVMGVESPYMEVMPDCCWAAMAGIDTSPRNHEGWQLGT